MSISLILGSIGLLITLLGVGLILLAALGVDRDTYDDPEPEASKPMHHWLDPKNRT